MPASAARSVTGATLSGRPIQQQQGEQQHVTPGAARAGLFETLPIIEGGQRASTGADVVPECRRHLAAGAARQRRPHRQQVGLDLLRARQRPWRRWLRTSRRIADGGSDVAVRADRTPHRRRRCAANCGSSAKGWKSRGSAGGLPTRGRSKREPLIGGGRPRQIDQGRIQSSPLSAASDTISSTRSGSLATAAQTRDSESAAPPAPPRRRHRARPARRQPEPRRSVRRASSEGARAARAAAASGSPISISFSTRAVNVAGSPPMGPGAWSSSRCRRRREGSRTSTGRRASRPPRSAGPVTVQSDRRGSSRPRGRRRRRRWAPEAASPRSVRVAPAAAQAGSGRRVAVSRAAETAAEVRPAHSRAAAMPERGAAGRPGSRATTRRSTRQLLVRYDDLDAARRGRHLPHEQIGRTGNGRDNETQKQDQQQAAQGSILSSACRRRTASRLPCHRSAALYRAVYLIQPRVP